MRNLKQAGTKAFLWDLSGKFVLQGINFIVAIILTRLLSPSDFGQIAIVLAITGIATVFTDVGLNSSLIQRRKVHDMHYTSVFYLNIFIGFVMSVVIFLLAPMIASYYEDNNLSSLIRVACFIFILSAIGNVQTAKLSKELNHYKITQTSIISSITSGIAGISLAVSGAGVWSLAAQLLVYSFLYNILIWRASSWNPSLKFSTKAISQLWAFGSRIYLVEILETIFSKIDSLIIGKLYSTSLLGYFNRAKTLDNIIINYSSGSLISVLFPVLSKVQTDLPRFQNITIKTLNIITFIIFFLVGLFYLNAQEIVVIIFGENWSKTTDYFEILILSSFGYPINSLLVNILYGRGNAGRLLKLEILKKLIFGVNLAVAFTWGIEGYLYGLIAAIMFSVLLNSHYSAKEINLPIKTLLSPVFLQMALTIPIVIFVSLINHNSDLTVFSSLIIKTIEFSGIYFLANWIFKVSAYNHFIGEFKSFKIT